MAYRVEFKQVGRGKKEWTVDCDSFPKETDIMRMVHKSGALALEGIDCIFQDNDFGIIEVGRRSVGAFRVFAKESPNGGEKEKEA